LQDADLSDAEKEHLQTVAEQIHFHWTKNKDYLPPLGMGTLATLDSSPIVTPPNGFEIGYVPIVTRQTPALKTRNIQQHIHFLENRARNREFLDSAP
jgi:hypothetical protein